MKDERIKKANQDLKEVSSDINQARNNHEQMEMDFGTSIRNIELHLGSDHLSESDYVFFMEQLDFVKDLKNKEYSMYSDYETDLIRKQKNIEEDIEQWEKEEMESGEE